MIDPFGADKPIARTNADDFLNGDPLFNKISFSIKGGVRYFVIDGPPKSGKTSFTNVISENLPAGFIGVQLNLEFLGENPLFSMYDQIFSAIFRKLLEKGYMEQSNKFFKTWKKQVSGGDLEINPEDELLEVGSRIALHIQNPNSAVTIDSSLIQNDISQLKVFTKEIYSEFIDFVIILDDPQGLLNVDPKTQNAFLGLFYNPASLMFLSTTNLDFASTSKERINSSLLEFFVSRLPDNTNVTSLQKLDSTDISQLIKKVRREIDSKKLDEIARSVRNVAGGHPHLSKLLLNNMERRSELTGKFEVDTSSCEDLIKSQYEKISESSQQQFLLLKKVRESDSRTFLNLARILLASTESSTGRSGVRQGITPVKSLSEIILSIHAPKPISADALDEEIRIHLKTIRDFWESGLFRVIDNDGRLLSLEERPLSDFINSDTKILSQSDPLILAYIRICARELNTDFSIPSRQDYLSTTTSLFARDLVNFLVPRDEVQSKRRYILAGKPNDKSEDAFEVTITKIKAAIEEDNLPILFKYFYKPIRNTLIFNQETSNSMDLVKHPVALNLIFSELNLPELREFSYVLMLDDYEEQKNVELRFKSWLDKNSPIMELFYKIKVIDYSFQPISRSIFRDLVFLSGRSARLRQCFDFFFNEEYAEVRNRLQTDLQNELQLFDAHETFLESRQGFQRVAQSFSYMAAATGLYSDALKGFEVALKDSYSNSMMIEDNRAICYANLGDFGTAVEISGRNLVMLRDKPFDQDEYYKLIYLPLKSNNQVLGSNSLNLKNWSLELYELQHAILLMSKKKLAPLKESEIDFLESFGKSLNSYIDSFSKDTTLPIQRMLAFYLASVDSRTMAEAILERLISTSDQTPQVQAAISDLDEIKAWGA